MNVGWCKCGAKWQGGDGHTKWSCPRWWNPLANCGWRQGNRFWNHACNCGWRGCAGCWAHHPHFWRCDGGWMDGPTERLWIPHTRSMLCLAEPIPVACNDLLTGTMGKSYCRDSQCHDAPKTSGPFPAGAFGLIGGKDGKYCADEGHRTICNRGGLGGWEKFTIEKVGSNKYALKGGKDKKYCADEGEHGVKCNRNAAPDGGWEQFEVEVVDADKNIVAFKGGKDGKFCADEGNMIKCNRGSVGSWEKFTVVAA